MKTLVLTIAVLALMITGAACSGGADMQPDVQQDNAADDSTTRTASLGFAAADI